MLGARRCRSGFANRKAYRGPIATDGAHGPPIAVGTARPLAGTSAKYQAHGARIGSMCPLQLPAIITRPTKAVRINHWLEESLVRGGFPMEDERPKLADIEREHILATLARCDGNRTHAAQMLGISVRCLRNKLHRYVEDGFGVPEPRAGVGHSSPSLQVRRAFRG
jgi:hypothetical protein